MGNSEISNDGISDVEEQDFHYKKAESVVKDITNEITVLQKKEKLLKLKILRLLEESERFVRVDDDQEAMRAIVDRMSCERDLKKCLLRKKTREHIKEEFGEAETVFDKKEREIRMSKFLVMHNNVTDHLTKMISELEVKKKRRKFNNEEEENINLEDFDEETEEQVQFQRIKQIVSEMDLRNWEKLGNSEQEEKDEKDSLMRKIYEKRIEEITEEVEEIITLGWRQITAMKNTGNKFPI